jgi:hypothetical protein
MSFMEIYPLHTTGKAIPVKPTHDDETVMKVHPDGAWPIRHPNFVGGQHAINREPKN